LGNGTSAGSNWILTGLSLPTGQNIYIRARGYYRSGENNASESITESVRNAFIIATPTPTPTPAPTPPPTVDISGDVIYCSDPNLNPVPGVTMTLTGTSSGSTMTAIDASYSFTGLPFGGTYTVTPTKAALSPGSAGISTVDVIATQRHFLGIAIIPVGCRLTAADVNGDSAVNTVDVVAIQRFFLGLSTGTANVGKYKFTPANRSYPGLVSDQSGQNYDALVFGDTASSFVYRADGNQAQGAAGGDTNEIASTVAAISLPEALVDQSRSNFIAEVRTSAIDGTDKLVGFQGDFTFDERVVSFQSPPVQTAGLTARNWNVSGNVLDGPGPIRTLRISAYSNDFVPLSGRGTLFELRMRTVLNSTLRIPNSAFPLVWAAPPNDFIFIDADLTTQRPGYAAPGSVKASISSIGRDR
jgi:hypothetical protein